MRNVSVSITGTISFFLVLSACQNEPSIPTGPSIMEQDTLIHPPAEQHLSQDQLQKEIDEEVDLVIDVENTSIINEAEEVVRLTNQTIAALLNEDFTTAENLLEKTTAKARLITMGGQEHTSVVSEVKVKMHDKVDDISSAIELKKRVDSLIHAGDFQTARYLLPRMASEITITRESLSMPLYTKALEKADKLMNLEVYNQAIRVLNAALNKRETSHRAIPLPLIRAERMLSETEQLFAEKGDIQTDNMGKLLNNAEYQIKFMEVLGYGKDSEKFSQLYQNIHTIRNSLENNETKEAEKQIKLAIENLNKLRETVVRYKSDGTTMQKSD